MAKDPFHCDILHIVFENEIKRKNISMRNGRLQAAEVAWEGFYAVDVVYKGRHGFWKIIGKVGLWCDQWSLGIQKDPRRLRHGQIV